MPQIEGSVKPKTYSCPQCGAFMWTEGTCDPCKGIQGEAEIEEQNNVTYKVVDGKTKAIKRAR